MKLVLEEWCSALTAPSVKENAPSGDSFLTKIQSVSLQGPWLSSETDFRPWTLSYDCVIKFLPVESEQKRRGAARGWVWRHPCLVLEDSHIDLVAKGLQQCKWGHTLGGNGIQPRIWVCILSMTAFPITVELNCGKRDKLCKAWTVHCMAIYRKRLLTSGLDYGKNYIWIQCKVIFSWKA